MNYEQDSLARQELPQQQETGIEQIPVVREIRGKRAKIKFKFSLVVKIALLFSLGLLVIFRFAQITELGYQTNDINKAYDALTLENEQLQVNIEKEINLSEIRAIAESRLNLQAPNESQIVYIETTASDRVDYTGEMEEETGAIQDVISWIKDFFGVGK